MSLQLDRPTNPVDSPSSASQTDTSIALSRDDIFHLLQTSRRRETIRYLLEKNGPVKMRDVAEHVSAREHETTVQQLSSKQRQRVYIPLYQSHLPKLDKKGVIEYDQSRGIIRSGDQLELFRPYIEVLAGEDTQSEADSGDQNRMFNTSDKAQYATGAALAVSLVLVSAAELFEISDAAVVTIVSLLFGASILTLTRIDRVLPDRLTEINWRTRSRTDEL
ncbi:hypothetical protein [Halostagnicola sp. A-GB9-2]|uniref:DUF7344 domain-containing protein n=1 Tax=Halostagnicola sp. A-GB9-2 TaxID=3048066 RepID=UPI0024C08659|nr:hypothetical protein [Halostagnicola sp. A-GB9-2]MDJ1430879.1 hypothetical protein [Halostagnicola sp. A-GB9-2]